LEIFLGVYPTHRKFENYAITRTPDPVAQRDGSKWATDGEDGRKMNRHGLTSHNI